MAHRQFENRGRVVLYMEQGDINALTARAKRAGRLLIPWLREILLRELETQIDFGAPKKRINTHNKRLRGAETSTAVTELSNADYMMLPESATEQIEKENRLGLKRSKYPGPLNAEHTAKSNRLTCMCGSCVEYRHAQQIPFGGFPKKAKRQ